MSLTRSNLVREAVKGATIGWASNGIVGMALYGTAGFAVGVTGFGIVSAAMGAATAVTYAVVKQYMPNNILGKIVAVTAAEAASITACFSTLEIVSCFDKDGTATLAYDLKMMAGISMFAGVA